MVRATRVLGQHHWRDAAADTVVLEFDDRHRRRMVMTATRGLEFMLDLPEVIALRGGDALLLDDGRLVEVIAAPESLAEIRCNDPNQLVRIAWHLGNRHLPTQIAGKALRIRRDHVVEDMVRGLGARVVEIEAPFDPEGGAYASVSNQGSSGLHAHDHDHSHHRHAHGREAHDHPHHVHDDTCGHGHDEPHPNGHAHPRDHAT